MLRGRASSGRVAGFCLALLLALGLGRQPAAADDAALLTVAPLGAPEIALSRADLEAMGGTSLVTGTPWSDGQQTYVGITGRQLLAALKARGVTMAPTGVSAIANNDYRIVMPIDAFDQDTTLIAYARDGAALPVRDKGPLWIVFPFDQDPDKYRSTTYKAYAIWGLVRLEFQNE